MVYGMNALDSANFKVDSNSPWAVFLILVVLVYYEFTISVLSFPILRQDDYL